MSRTVNKKVSELANEEFTKNGYGITLSLEEQKYYWLGFIEEASAKIDLLVKNGEHERAKKSLLNDLVEYGTRRYTSICKEIDKRFSEMMAITGGELL